MEAIMSDDFDRVVPLDELPDFEVAEGDPDVRGWEVLASDGTRIGEVDDLLIDTDAMKVRYLDVDLTSDFDAGEDRHILVPIGYARLDDRDDRVIVDELSGADIATLPVYDHSPLTREYEADLRSRYDRGGVSVREDADFYASDLYDPDRFYSARRQSRGNPLA